MCLQRYFNKYLRLAGKGDHSAADRNAVSSDCCISGAANMDMVFRSPETAYDGIFLPVIGDAGLDPQTVIVRINTQDRLRNGEEGPTGGSGEPAVLGMTGSAGGPACDHLCVAIGFCLVDFGLFFQIGRADPAVDVKSLIAPAQRSFCTHDPGIIVTEYAAVFLEAGRIGGDFTQLQMIFRIAGVQQLHTILTQQVFSGGIHGFQAVFRSAHTRQGAEALGFNKDLAFFAFGGTDLVAIGIIGPEEPLAILPVMVVYLCLSKFIIKGVTAGSVKG